MCVLVRVACSCVLLALIVGCNRAESKNSDTAASPPHLVTGPSELPRPASPAATAELPDPIVTMHTSLGDVILRLNQKRAPRTVSNFVDYVITRHYDGTIFHQIDGDYVALAGTYSEKLIAKPTRYSIPNESANGLKNTRGTIAMARDPADPNSATSQFFINLADNPQLDRTGDAAAQAGYCVFGEVVRGMEVLDKIAQVRTATLRGFDKMPVQTVLINSATVVR